MPPEVPPEAPAGPFLDASAATNRRPSVRSSATSARFSSSANQSTTASAQQAFSELIRRYPESRYAADARLKLDLITDHLAGKEMEVGRFYQRSGQWLAATYRFRDVVDKYETSSHTPEALERLVECYLALGIPDEAHKAAAVLGANYNGSYWYKQSLKLLNEEQRHIAPRTASRK